MSTEIAQLVIVGITLVGAVVWLVSLSFLLKSTRALELAKSDELTDRQVLAGAAEVAGDAKTLSALATTLLAKGNFGPLQIVEKTADRVVFERLGPNANQPVGRWFRRGELRFASLGQNRTQIEWIVEPESCHGLLWAGGVCQFVSLIALPVGCWALCTFVAPATEAAIRWQAVQMAQVVHVLWPPFLLGGLCRQRIGAIAAEFEALVRNLPYLGNQT